MNKRWMAAIGVAVLALAGCGGGAELPDGQYDLGNGMSVAVRDVVVDDQQVAVNLEYFNDTDAVVDKTLAYDAFLFTAGGVNLPPCLVPLLDSRHPRRDSLNSRWHGALCHDHRCAHLGAIGHVAGGQEQVEVG